MKTYQQVPQQDDDSHLANRRNKDGSLLLDLGAEVLRKDVKYRTTGDSMGYRTKPTFSLEKLIHTAPSRSRLVSNLYLSPGTPEMTTSHSGATSFRVAPSISTISCRRFFKPSPRVNFCTPVISTLYTQAPSLASSAANGRPTTSERFTTQIV